MKSKCVLAFQRNGKTVHREVDGYVFGDWQAHRVWWRDDEVPDPGWRVSHRCGFALWSLADELSEIDAVQIASALNERLPDFPSVEVGKEPRYPLVPPDPWAYLVQATVAEVLCEGRAR